MMRYAPRRMVLAALLTLPSALVSAQATQTEAFTDAKSFATANPAIKSAITSAAAAQVPGQDSARENELKSLYGKDLNGPGRDKVNACARRTSGSGTYNDQECETVNFVIRNAETRPRFAIDKESDPTIVRSATVRAAPSAYTAGATGLTGNYSACPNAVSGPPVADCAGRSFCIEGYCFDAGTTPDQDFVKAVTAVEVAREAGVYVDETTFQVFKGQDNRCSKTAVSNCCKDTKHPTDNLSNFAISGGSPYAFDVLNGGDMKSSIALSVDPTALALETSGMVVQEMLACEKEEVLVALRRSQALCHSVGEFCSKSVNLVLTRVCVERKETYCCFNSKISRMINEAARDQIQGLDWGTAEAPSCTGLTLAQFQSLDLSRIDFSDFYADIKPTNPDHATVLKNADRKIQSYFKD